MATMEDLSMSWLTVYLLLPSISLYLGLVVAYRLTLHPLAKYPGPLLSRISGFSLFVQSTTGERHLTQLREHQKYGPIVRITPNTLSFSSPVAILQVYQSGKESNPLRKSTLYKTIDAPAGALSIHTETSRRKHAAHRRVLDHAFSAAATRSNMPLITETIERFCNILDPNDDVEWSEPKNMSEYATWFAYDAMGALVFGQEFNCLTEDAHRFVPKLIIDSSSFLYSAGYLPFQWLVQKVISSPTLMNYIGGDLAREEHAYVEYATQCVNKRLSKEDTTTPLGAKRNVTQPDDRRDMMHYIINARDPITKKGFTRSEIDADSGLLIAAGSDTTSTVLAALFFYLTLPTSISILYKLQTEIRDRTKFPTLASIIDTKVATSLPYLRGCIDEALRLAPPIPTHLPRTIVSKTGVTIDGHHIPRGTTVGVAAYVVHHDESAYPDSWSFKPERWNLSDNPSEEEIEQLRRAQEAFIPFSVGSRGCIGRDLAYREMCLCMARLVYLFDFRRAVDTSAEVKRKRMVGKMKGGLVVREDEFQLFDCFLAGKDGPDVQFRRCGSF